jgi:hypothetical protein
LTCFRFISLKDNLLTVILLASLDQAREEMKLVGLTGGIACGKTSVTLFLRQLGIPVIDCDEIAHDVVRKVREERPQHQA